MSRSAWVAPATWVAAIRAADVEQSAWPGPRPLTEEDGHDFLVGRDKELREFLQNITFCRLIHLTGMSGVGKSSLLMAGIIPELRDRGYTVTMCRDWSNVGREDIDIFLAQRLHDSLRGDQKFQFSRDTDLFWELDELRGRGVIILDQFEEIVRHNRTIRDSMFKLLTNLNLETGIPVVLSYRAEYSQVVEVFDRDMRIERNFAQAVPPVGDEAGMELIHNPRRRDAASREVVDHDRWTDVIDADVAAEIQQDWITARADESHDRIPVGMLHLQALLYVLSRRTRFGTISLETYSKFKSAAAAAGWTTSTEIMGFALEESAQIRISLASEVAADVGMDLFLIRGISTCFARTVPHLSSGGFKLERDIVDLSRIVLGDELDQVRRTLGSPEDLLREVTLTLATTSIVAEATSILAAPRSEIAAAIDERLGERALGHERWAELLNTIDDGPSTGLVMGLGPMVGLLEQLRRFGWALLWLHELNLARLNSDSSGSGTLTLVHDGLGDALERWSQRFEAADRTHALFALMAPEGQSFVWDQEAAKAELCGEPGKPKVHVNLGLKGDSVISATLRHAVFVNCDFRGTLFLGCSFEGVTFLNCRLDGALISDCTLMGPPDADDQTSNSQRRDTRSQDAPTYLVPDASGTLASLLSHYREVLGDRPYILSQEPGSPAISTDDPTSRVEWEAIGSGLVIEGSQLSALTIRGTVFRDDAALRFQRVRGSGLDIAELAVADGGATRPRVLFFESIVRHASFTGRADDQREVEILAEWSVIAQWWVGRSLGGGLRARDCSIGQLWIESTEGFTTDIDKDCVITGLIGARPDGKAVRLDVIDASAALGRAPTESLERFRANAGRTDYRRN